LRKGEGGGGGEKRSDKPLVGRHEKKSELMRCSGGGGGNVKNVKQRVRYPIRSQHRKPFSLAEAGSTYTRGIRGSNNRGGDERSWHKKKQFLLSLNHAMELVLIAGGDISSAHDG